MQPHGTLASGRPQDRTVDIIILASIITTNSVKIVIIVVVPLGVSLLTSTISSIITIIRTILLFDIISYSGVAGVAGLGARKIEGISLWTLFRLH